MKFFWPAPLDSIDPTFDFIYEQGSYNHARQKKQKFPHEIFDTPVYHGFMISKIYVEQGKNCRWNSSQLSRFFREGAKRFLHIPEESPLLIMGDSGAYTKTYEERSRDHLIDQCLEVLKFYQEIGVDYGLSPDHVISGFHSGSQPTVSRDVPVEWRLRWQHTIDLADCFWSLRKRKNISWTPIGVAQGWDIESYLESVKMLEQIGYSYIALGGLNRLPNKDIVDVVKSCYNGKSSTTQFHLLGVSRMEYMKELGQYGVTSFDSSMPLRQAFSDDRNNYHSSESNFLAIRIPQSLASPRLVKMASKELDRNELCKLEAETLLALRKYDKEELSIEEVLNVLQKGIAYRQEKNFLDAYKQTLQLKPWQNCSCIICNEIGIEVVLLRNRERNLRRGFHNLYVLSNKLKQLFPSSWEA